MPEYRVTYSDQFGGERTVRVRAHSVSDAAEGVRRYKQPARILLITETITGERHLPNDRSADVPTSEVWGYQPQDLDADRDRKPSARDRLRLTVQSPEVVQFKCKRCRWKLECPYAERMSAHTCPTCGLKQHILGYEFAWNTRMIREREAKADRRADADRRRREAVRRERAKQAELARRQQEQQRQQQRAIELEFRQRNGLLAAVCGLAESPELGATLDHETLTYVDTIHQMVELFNTDVQQMFKDQVTAERGVAYGRPAASVGSIFSFVSGEALLGLAFGAVAVGARALSNDWKKMKLAEYKQKWQSATSQFNQTDWEVFFRLLEYKHPGTMRVITGNNPLLGP